MTGQPTILIVDDSKLARMLARKAVTTILPDATIAEAGDGEEARAVAVSAHFDYALIDLDMPGENGFQVASWLRRNIPDITIAIRTANIQESSRNKAEETGFGFIAKPISADKIRLLFRKG